MAIQEDAWEPWLWDRYERTDWVRDDPQDRADPMPPRMYFGHFSRQTKGKGQLTYETCEVRFWAHQPRVAMRQILASGKNPAVFADTEVN